MAGATRRRPHQHGRGTGESAQVRFPRRQELRVVRDRDPGPGLGSGRCDRDYGLRREHALLIAVNCGQAGGTCFCVSMETGPAVTSSHDLVLTEILDDRPHRFLVAAGSEIGADLLTGFLLQEASEADHAAADEAVANAASQMGRRMVPPASRNFCKTIPSIPGGTTWRRAA